MTPHIEFPNHRKTMKVIGKKISLLRKINGLSRDDLANKINICAKLLLKYETGRAEITIDKLIEIAEIFGLEANKLFH